MKKYKIIDKYSNQQRNEFSDLSQAQEYLNKIQKIGKIGILKGKEVFKKTSDLGTAELIKRQMTVRTYITRYKRNLEDSESLKKRTRYQELLDKYQIELDDINKRLGQ